MADHDHRTNASRTPASDRGSDSGSSNDNDDDVWGDDDNVSYDRSIAEREWSRLHENFGNSGYLEGIEEGKESTLQDGFNQGWTEGVQYGHELGRLRGLISPLLEYIQSRSANTTDLLRSLDETQQKTWIQTASDLVKELIELDIAKVFDKAYFDDGLGPSASKSQQQTSTLSSSDSGCCGGSSSKNEEGGGSCCKGDNKEESGSATTEKSGCCSKSSSSSSPSTTGATSSSCSKGSNCGQTKSEEGTAASTSAWSSRPDQVLADYKSRTLDLLKQVKLERLLESN